MELLSAGWAGRSPPRRLRRGGRSTLFAGGMFPGRKPRSRADRALERRRVVLGRRPHVPAREPGGVYDPRPRRRLGAGAVRGGLFGAAGGAVRELRRTVGRSRVDLACDGVGRTGSRTRRFDFGTGAAMIVGGDFSSLDGLSAECLARWAAPRPTLLRVPSRPRRPRLGHGPDSSGTSTTTCSASSPRRAGRGRVRISGSGRPTSGSSCSKSCSRSASLPFHFLAACSTPAFGPYPLPVGTVVEGVCFDFTGDVLGCASTVGSITVQQIQTERRACGREAATACLGLGVCEQGEHRPAPRRPRRGLRPTPTAKQPVEPSARHGLRSYHRESGRAARRARACSATSAA